MADMDTYDDQRGYEGNYTTNANALSTSNASYGYYGRREFDNQLDQTNNTAPAPTRRPPSIPILSGTKADICLCR